MFKNKEVSKLQKPVEYKINDEVLEAFNKIAKEKPLDKSQSIENKIEQYSKDAKVNDKLFYLRK